MKTIANFEYEEKPENIYFVLALSGFVINILHNTVNTRIINILVKIFIDNFLEHIRKVFGMGFYMFAAK